MNIGFLLNQIDGRGTGNAVFNYAHYNEEILGNKSRIITMSGDKHNVDMVNIYAQRFGEIYTLAESVPHEILKDLDAVYHIKSGESTFKIYGIPYLVHAVFNGGEPHGDRFAVISEWMGKRDMQSFVPHIVQHPDSPVDSLRTAMGIPETDTVFGRIGGYDTFDIPWAWDSIKKVLDLREDYWFLFVNTEPYLKHPRVIYYPETLNPNVKKSFIMTCDAMLHARKRGETFGISVGEFSVLGKPIFTYGKSYEKAHIYELKGTAKTYDDQEELTDLLLSYKREEAHPFYDKFTPELVMQQFKEVFLD